MSTTRDEDYPGRVLEITCCKCSKSNGKMKKQVGSPYFESAVSKFEERRGELVNRQKYLKEKIRTMERSIPALIAYNMFKTGENCDDSPLCKVKRILNKLPPHRDPTGKLLDKLRNTVESLNGETAELHDKIIAADIRLEESKMELDSLQLANEELEDRLRNVEKELRRHRTPSLGSVHSDDLVCLTKIRQLGEAEVRLKNSIRQLEEREGLYHRQMDCIFKSKEFSKASSDGITKRIRQLECNEKKMQCALHTQSSNVQQLKKTLLRNEKEISAKKMIRLRTKKCLPTSRTNDVESTMSTKETSEKNRNPAKAFASHSDATSNRRIAEQEKLESPKKIVSYRSPQKCKDYKEDCLAASICPTRTLITCYDDSSCPAVSRSRVPDKLQSARNNPLPFCDTCVTDFFNRLQPSMSSLKSCHVSFAAKSNASRRQICLSACNESSTSSNSPCKIINNLPAITSKCCKGNNSWSTDRRCSCKGMSSSMGVSASPCGCAKYSSTLDKEEHRENDDSARIICQSSTDEEYCECCECDCNESD